MIRFREGLLRCKDVYQSFAHRFLSFFVIKFSLNLARWIIIAIAFKKLNLESFSIFAASISIIEILKVLNEFGTENFIYSRLSEKKPLTISIKNLIAFRVLFAVLITIIFNLLIYKTKYFVVWPLTTIILAFAIQNASFAFLQRDRNLKGIIQVILTTLTVFSVVILYLIYYPLDVTIVCMLIVITDLTTMITCFYLTKKNWGKLKLNPFKVLKGVRRIFNVFSLSAGISFIVIIYSRLDVLLVRPLLGIEAQALYSFAFRLIEPFPMVLSLFYLSLLTEVSSINKNELSYYYDRILNFLSSYKTLLTITVINFFLILGLIIFARYFSQSNIDYLLVILGSSISIKFINMILSVYFIRNRFLYDLLKISLINLIFIFISGVILGNYFGVIGIAVAASLGEVINFFLQKNKIQSHQSKINEPI